MVKTALAASLALGVNCNNILIAGDSWGTFGDKTFREVMQKHSPETNITNIAIGGTTAGVWSNWPEFGKLKTHAADADYLWLTLGGNDALFNIPSCSQDKNKSAHECADAFMDEVVPKMEKILEAVKDANPSIRVIGFGYDVLGMDKLPLCPPVALELFPQCAHAPEGGSGAAYIACWNKQFTRIHTDGWEQFAQKYDHVDTVNLLGSLQASEGDPEAALGKPNLNKWSPKDLMQANCIHPTAKGFEVIFENLWNLYWSKELGPSSVAV